MKYSPPPVHQNSLTFSVNSPQNSPAGEAFAMTPESPNPDQNPPAMTEISQSWLRGRGNHCETCVDWSKDHVIEFVGLCNSSKSLDFGELTDSRYRCPCFKRRDGT